MQSLLYNKVLTSSRNLLNTILKVEKQNWIDVCGLVPLKGQKVEKLESKCYTKAWLYFCLFATVEMQGFEALLLRTAPDNIVGAPLPVY